MPVYQNYFPQMSNGGYMQSPYQQRADFLQNYQQSLQAPQMPVASTPMNVLGKFVDGIEAVRAIDIPMDGSMYYFPKADGTEIYGKQWLANGQTRILPFKPILDGEPNNLPRKEEKLEFALSEDVTRAFMERFDGLENRINELLVQNQTKTRAKTVQSQTKKEDETE